MLASMYWLSHVLFLRIILIQTVLDLCSFYHRLAIQLINYFILIKYAFRWMRNKFHVVSDSDKCHPSSRGTTTLESGVVLENCHEEDNLTSCVNPDFSGKGRGGGVLIGKCFWNPGMQQNFLLPDPDHITTLHHCHVHFLKPRGKEEEIARMSCHLD